MKESDAPDVLQVPDDGPASGSLSPVFRWLELATAFLLLRGAVFYMVP